MDINNALDSLSALSQQTRLEVFRLLVKAGDEGLLAGETSRALGVRQNTMSANLAVLMQAGLIRNVREGRSIRYFADFRTMSGLLAFLLEDCCGGKPEVCQPVIDQIAADCCSPAQT